MLHCLSPAFAFMLLTAYGASSSNAFSTVICYKATSVVSNYVPVAFSTALATLNTNRIALSGSSLHPVLCFIPLFH